MGYTLVENKLLIENIISAILEKKGKDIVNIFLGDIENAVCDNFIICHGDSNTQVNAIADSIEDNIKKNLREDVGHREGMGNAQWVLLDYSNTIVHIFQKEYRDYYKLEELWGDAVITKIMDE